MLNSKVGATHTGAFRDWKEDADTVDIFLPLPPATTKGELVCVITPESLHISHARLEVSLLIAEPLAGPVIPEESTWYLEGDLLNLVLAKQWRGETKSDQYWGAQLAAKDATYKRHLRLTRTPVPRSSYAQNHGLATARPGSGLLPRVE